MGIKRWVADADNTVTNAFEPNLVTRGTGSNMGAADSLEVFMLYAQASASSTNDSLGLGAGNSRELSRILIKFPTTEISASRTSGSIPPSGSVTFHLKMFNAEHPFTLPQDFQLVFLPVSASWQEGPGLDMDNYTDLTYNESGSNWMRRGRKASFVADPQKGNTSSGSLQGHATNNFGELSKIFVTGADGHVFKFQIGTASNDGRCDTDAIFVSGAAGGTADQFFHALSGAMFSASMVDYAASTYPQAFSDTHADGHFTVTSQSLDGPRVAITSSVFSGWVSEDPNNLIQKSGGHGISADSEGQPYNQIQYLTVAGLSSSGDRGTWQAGGSYHTSSTDFSYTASFSKGYEDLEIDITGLMEHWFSGAWGGAPGEGYANYGLGIKLIESLESGSVSYYTKKFFSRSTEFFFKRPVIEARWDSRTEDDRGNTFLSSALVPAVDNLNSIYLYNYVNGRLVDIPTLGSTNKIFVSLYSGSSTPAGDALNLPIGGGVVAAGDTNITGNRMSTGVYSASFALTGGHSLTVGETLTTVFDVWHTGTSQAIRYLTSSFEPKERIAHTIAPTFEYVTNITNLRAEYSRKDTARFRFFVREKNWNPTIYNVATATTPSKTIISASYKIMRTTDDLFVVPYGTGSKYSTYLSHDLSGNYFDLDINLLESDYSYGIRVSYYNPSIGSWVEQPEEFKFRVVE